MNDSFGLSAPPRPRPGLLNRLASSVATHLGLQGLCDASQLGARLAIQRVEIPLPGLDEDLDRICIAQMSDLHLGLFMREHQIAHCVEVVNRARPDFVAITGDLLTTTARRYARRIAVLLGELRPKTATLACLGNHDYGIWHPKGWQSPSLAEYLADQLGSAGVRVLINESATYVRGLGSVRFAGVGEYWSSAYKPKLAMGGDRVPAGQVPATPTVALCHNPDAAPKLADLGAGVILAGHTHGKNAADTLFTRAFFPMANRQFIAGHYELPVGGHLYVNRGIGNSRRTCANSQPEITLITLRSPSCLARRDFLADNADRTAAPALSAAGR